MANFKYKKTQGKRAGCKMCKYWKLDGQDVKNPDNERHSSHVGRAKADMELSQYVGANVRHARRSAGEMS